MPNVCWSRVRRSWWAIVSKAAERSKSVIMHILLLSVAVRRSCCGWACRLTEEDWEGCCGSGVHLAESERFFLRLLTEKINLTHGGSSLSHWDQGTFFLKKGLTRADLPTDGKTPDSKLLNTTVMQCNKDSRHSSNSGVGNSFSSHVFECELSMVRLTKLQVWNEWGVCHRKKVQCSQIC